jgi:hypothetical protein
MDFAGEFRLPPLPRAPRGQRQIKVYTANSITEYDWNNIPFAKKTGFVPACVWPAEVFAAMEAETGILDEQSDHNRANYNHVSDTITTERRSRKTSVIKEREIVSIPSLSLKDVLSSKVYDDLCGSSPR